MPTDVSSSFAFALASFLLDPIGLHGEAHVFQNCQQREQLKGLENHGNLLPPAAVQVQRPVVAPLSCREPSVGRSSPAIRLRSVLLPLPEGPMTAYSFPAEKVPLIPSRA